MRQAVTEAVRKRRIARRAHGCYTQALASGVLSCSLLVACGGNDVQYEPKSPPEGVSANLPSVPTIPSRQVKDGENYTVWGASYHLRSRVHNKDVSGQDLKIAGHIIKTNLDDAPKCAIHPTGKEDPKGCEAPIPTFWLADSADADPKDSIKVLGWASNFAQIYDAVRKYKTQRARRKKDPEPMTDNFWGVAIPNPLPGPGAKVVVSGNYSTAFTRATSGTEADPIMGVLTYNELQYVDEPPELATLPGIRP